MNESENNNTQITPEHAQILARMSSRHYQNFEEGVHDRANKKGKSEFIDNGLDLAIKGATTYSSGFGLATVVRNSDFIIGEPEIALVIASCIFLGVARIALKNARLNDIRLVLVLLFLIGGATTEIYLFNWGGEKIDKPVALYSPK